MGMAEKQEEKEREKRRKEMGKGKAKAGEGAARCSAHPGRGLGLVEAWGRLSMNQLSMKKMSSLNNCPIEVLGLSSPLLLASTSLNLLMMFITFRAE